MDRSNGKIVTVFGSSRPESGQVAYDEAYEVGLAIGRAGYIVCNGGYGGTMEATARGAKDAGSSAIGITCSLFSKSNANAWIDREIPTSNLFTRLEELIEPACAFVALPGGSGTLVELSMVWELVAKRLIPARPIILYTDFWRPVIEIAAQERPRTAECVVVAESSEQIVDILNAL